MKIITRIFDLLGFHLDDEGAITTSTWFAVLMCEMAVKQKEFVKLGKNHYNSKENESSTIS